MTVPSATMVSPVVAFALSPLQEGMLFHALAAEVPGVDLEQIVCTSREPLDQPAMKAAWRAVIDRHDALRTRFQWEGLDRPLQIVAEEAPLDFRVVRRSGVDAESHRRDLHELLRRDRSEAFDLSALPLMRATLLVGDDAEWNLVWTFHHILLDGRSFPAILQDVFDFYGEIRAGRTVRSERSVGQREFIGWLETRDRTGGEAFWRRTLTGFTTPTPLPLQGLSQPLGQVDVAAVERRLDPDVLRAISDFAEKNELTVNTVVQGAWALLLHHYTGEADVVFAATRAGRGSIDGPAAGAVGLLINTLPVRVAFHPDDRVVPWLQAIRRYHVMLREHEHTPLQDVRKWSDLGPGLSLFETLVVFENYLLDSRMRALGGAWSGRHFRYEGQTNFPLALIAYQDDGLLLRLEYRTSLYDAAIAAMILDHLAELLPNLAGDPDAHPAAVRYCKVEPSRAAKRVFEVGECIHELFEAQARARPSSTALVFEGARLTYAELDAKSNLLAAHLRSLGVERDTLVGLLTDRNADLVVGILGVLKAGGAYVPIDPSYPPDRVRFIAEDANVRVLVAHGRLGDHVANYAGPIVRLDEPTSWTTGAAPATWRHPDPDSLAYVIYTSGSTGRPKGVAVTHRNVVRLLRSTEGWFGFGPDDAWTLFHSYAFDFSVWEIWGALAYGGRVVVVPYLVSRSPEAFHQLLIQERVTVLNQTPSAFLQLIPFATDPAAPPTSLRWVVFGGEALDPATLRPWVRRFGGERPQLINMYGITETTVHVTFRRLTEQDILSGVRSVIGEPLLDLRLLVLDPRGRPTPVGVPGELHVGGDGLARGYLNRPELTATRFISDPYVPGERLYRTGDLARRLPDGDLEYLGRIDDQVKIRGFRIELGEIESAIRDVPGVRETVVIARRDGSGQHQLVAYVVPAEPGQTPSAGVLRAALQSRLPIHMVPAAFVSMDAIPLTAHGKVDKRALPAPPEGRPDVGTSYRAPTSPVEARLAEIWSTSLRIDRVGTDDNFFALGGDSIIAIRVVAEARRHGLTISPLDLFDAPTVGELASRVRWQGGAEREIGAGPDEAPLTPVQRWFVAQGFMALNHWNQAVVFQSRERLVAERVDRAMVALAAHHDALRVRLMHDQGGWSQRVGDARASVRTRDLGDLDEAAFARAALESQASLDLSAGPIVNALLARVDGRELLHIAIHHFAVDGVSWRIIREDFEATYDALERGQEPPALARATPFLAWATQLEASRLTNAFAADAADWEQTYPGDADPVAADGPAPRHVHFEGDAATLTRTLTTEETEVLLKTLPAATRAQINDLLLGAFAIALDPFARGAHEPLVELEGHGREDLVPGADLSRSVGWFTAIFPVRLPRGHGDPFEVVRATKERLQRLPRRRATFGITRWGTTDPAPDLVRPTILFNYLGQFDDVVEGSRRFSFAPYDTGAWHGPANRRTHLLECLTLVRGGRFQVSLSYSPAVHRAETAERLIDGFVAGLRSLIGRSDRAKTLLTPGDCRLVAIRENTLTALTERYGDVEEVLPLSPIQALYHSLDGSNSDIGLDQWHYTLLGPLDMTAFRQAWEDTVNRHGVLRSAFVTDPDGNALQVVCGGRRPLPWRALDWRDVPREVQEEQFAALLRADQAQGFDLAEPPLTRVTIAALSDTEHRVIWTHHHLQIDGWSWPIVLSDLSARYSQLVDGEGTELGAAPGYRLYLQWLAERDPEVSEQYWRETLAGSDAPTPLPGVRRPAADGASEPSGRFAEHAALIDDARTARLVSLARNRQVTLNTVIQTAWSLVLHEASRQPEVIFGAAFSGRPAELRDVERIVGPFVNNLPIRVLVPHDAGVDQLLSRVHATLGAAAQHQDTPLSRIHAVSGLRGNRRLFDSLVVFQNYQRGDGTDRLHRSTSVASFTAPVRTNYALTLLVIPGETLGLWLIADRTRVDDQIAAQMLGRVTSILDGFLEHCETVGALLAALPRVTWPQPVAATAVPRRADGPPPRSDLERQIAEVWAEVFGLDRVARDDNFFDLGGQSVTMLRLHKLMRERLGTGLSVARMFQHPTVASLAAAMEGPAKPDEVSADIESRGRRQRAAVAAAQRRRRGNES